MDIRKVKKLIEMLENSNLEEIEIQEGEESVRLVKSNGNINNSSSAQPIIVPQTSSPDTLVEQSKSDGTSEENLDGNFINSPMVGTFYRSPAPDAPSYVDVGSKVSEGETLCIIEAMKLMNELECEITGTIAEICIEDGQPVEFGQLLFRVDPS